MSDVGRLIGYYKYPAGIGAVALFCSFLAGLAAVRAGNAAELASISASGSPYPETISFVTIVTNNLAALFFVLLGVFLLGLTSILVLVYTGVVLGITVGAYLPRSSPTELLVLIVPHGIFELTGFLLGTAASLRLSWVLVRGALSEGDLELPVHELRTHAGAVAMATGSIVVGAWIESEVTPALHRFFF